jgi:Holliday junction resolvase-like predicted endonuclease
MAESNLKMVIEKALKSLERAATDLATVEVTTLTGEVKHVLGADNKGIDLSKAMERLNSGEIELVAHTNIKFDQDTLVFVSNKSNDEHRKLYQLHKDSVVAAQEARNAFLHFLNEFIRRDTL